MHSSAAGAVLFPAVCPTRKDGSCSFCCSLLLFGLKEKSNSVFKQHLCFQVVLSTGWDRPVWKLHIHGSTSPSRTLLGATGAKVGQDFQGV